MNLHTFKDAATAKRNALVNDLDVDDDDNEVAILNKDIEGEEENGQLQVRLLCVDRAQSTFWIQ